MTDTPDSPTDAPASAPKKRSGGLNAMLLADLKAMAAGMGIAGAGAMKKAQIVEAIKSAQAAGPAAAPSRARQPKTAPPQTEPTREQPSARATAPANDAPTKDAPTKDAPTKDAPTKDAPTKDAPQQDAPRKDAPTKPARHQDPSQQDGTGAPRERGQQTARKKADEVAPAQDGTQKSQGNQGNQGQGNQSQANQSQANQSQANQNQDDAGDEEGRGGRNRRRRGRDRTRTQAAGGTPAAASPRSNEPDTTILEDDVLVPAAGILDVLDNYAFVRTSGYLPGVDDVYLSLSMVRKFGLRRGDAIVGQVRQPREGERKEKFNPMVRIDTVNGADPAQSATRPDFEKLTPVNPTDRLRMETDATNLTGRAIDISAPIGKGQRGLVVSAPKAGKTTVLKTIAGSVTANNPECHLMVVLVDERPEEVTEFERVVKGEVIASTFDRPAADHTIVAELAIERAKRLVELGHDVVVLLDGLIRLGRAYNLTVPASGRVLSGGVDAAAVYPPKKFFGAARNIDNGGSLTIIATAVVESGSRMDEVIFDEFRGTDNMELRLRRDLADKRIFPAIDAVESSTRRDDLLMGEEELAIVSTLRRTLVSVGSERATQTLLDRLRTTSSNIEFLTQVQRTTPETSGAE